MKEIITCLFYIKGNKIDTYILEQNSVIKIGTFEEFEVGYEDVFWNWWIGVTSYILEEQCLDLCVLTDYQEVKLENEQIHLAENTLWTIDRIKKCLAKDYKATSFKLSYQNDDVTQELIIQGSGLNLEDANIENLNVVIKASNFNLQESKSVEEHNLSKQNEEVYEAIEEGILYKYFNSQTARYTEEHK